MKPLLNALFEALRENDKHLDTANFVYDYDCDEECISVELEEDGSVIEVDNTEINSANLSIILPEYMEDYVVECNSEIGMIFIYVRLEDSPNSFPIATLQGLKTISK